MRSYMLNAGLAVLVLAGCARDDFPSPPPVDPQQFTADHEEWRATRAEGLVTPPGGPVLWSGLWELAQGATPFGSDPSLPIVFSAADSPPLAGTLHRSGQEVRLEPAPGSPIGIKDGDVVTQTMVLENDRSRNTTTLALGSLGLRIHSEPGTDRLWLRMWDEDHPLRTTFQMPESYSPDPNWRVTARLDRYAELRDLPVADVTGGMIGYTSPGELVFRLNGEEHRLVTVGDFESTSYLILMWDSTATTTTYQAMRYMRVPAPGEDGWTIIDFNRAYNPPCVFTAFSVCALPPPENRLPVMITAGEKRWEKPAY